MPLIYQRNESNSNTDLSIQHPKARNMTPEIKSQSVSIRQLNQPGDLGWVIQANGEIYSATLGWNTEFEALVAKIVADYAVSHDAQREAAWLAVDERGNRLGSIFCVADERDKVHTAKLRILLVDPRARGLGVGTRLVNECLRFAKDVGYDRIVLWTTDVLISARKIYEAAGFELIDTEEFEDFGQHHIGQNWGKDLKKDLL